jgi:hypothetical protein
MTNLDLEIALTLHQKTCPNCRGRRRCVEGWRAFNDKANIIARTRDSKRAKA